VVAGARALRYLKPGLAAIQIFVGLKMLLFKWVDLPTGTSLLINRGDPGCGAVFPAPAASADEPG